MSVTVTLYFTNKFEFQTVTHLKLALHILCATLIGLLYGDSGSNASKSIENVGFLLIGVAYLWYTTVMPGVLKCKKKSNNSCRKFISIKSIFLLLFFAVPTEIDIVRKETFNNWYKVRTYFLANTLTTTPIHVRHTFINDINTLRCSQFDGQFIDFLLSK